MLLLGRQRAGETNLPKLLSVHDVIEFATIDGARDNRLDRTIGTLAPGKEADNVVSKVGWPQTLLGGYLQGH